MNEIHKLNKERERDEKRSSKLKKGSKSRWRQQTISQKLFMSGVIGSGGLIGAAVHDQPAGMEIKKRHGGERRRSPKLEDMKEKEEEETRRRDEPEKMHIETQSGKETDQDANEVEETSKKNVRIRKSHKHSKADEVVQTEEDEVIDTKQNCEDENDEFDAEDKPSSTLPRLPSLVQPKDVIPFSAERRAFATKVNKDDLKLPAAEAKPQETVEWILECVSDNLLFLKLDRDQKERVVQRMVLVNVAKGKALIRQGDTNAQTFYVTDRGTFDILVDGVKVGQYKRGGCFGELALLYDSPRAATILATST
eukprot:990478_1